VDPSTIFTQYINLGQNFAVLTRPYALTLLGSLILLEIGLIAVTYMTGGSDDPPAMLWSVVRLVFTGGFAYWWLIQSWTLAVIVVGSFNQLGQNLTGKPDLTPMMFLNTGLSIAKTIWAAPSSSRMVPNFGVALESVVLCAAILIIFLLIAALATMTIAAFYLITGPGSILIAFMPCRFTSAMSEGYFTWLMRVGVIVLFLYVVLGTAQTFANNYNTTLTAACNPVLATGPLPALGITPVDTSVTTCANPIPVDMLIQILADMVILASFAIGIPLIASALVGHGVNMTLEHLASAKYLASGSMRGLARAIGGLSYVVNKMAQRSNNQSTLNERMQAGAAAAANLRSGGATTPLSSPPPPPFSPPPPSGGWNGRPIAPPPSGGSGSGGAALTYYPGRPGAQTKAEAIDITKYQNKH
jgi:P-type conjugative transfer protein TrbL